MCRLFLFVGSLYPVQANILLFTSKFGKEDTNIDFCFTGMKKLNDASKLTVVALTNDVDVGELQTQLTKAIIIKWDIEQDERPANWEQMLWDAFGCGK